MNDVEQIRRVSGYSYSNLGSAPWLVVAEALVVRVLLLVATVPFTPCASMLNLSMKKHVSETIELISQWAIYLYKAARRLPRRPRRALGE
ncbi:hypothetical protein CC86DRAFT_80660 [Ophiobolus disseminans]|uniref:Uncharacterized protein n=1 Tax=Ophiobolus disseminans TaxID=1469910 RepID=A0A6A6ZP13_9PLEO|nr:hypothetical protein CC86DRAFT_80660 [Ophiobolus disseminans]